MNMDPDFYRTIAVSKPEHYMDLILVTLTLENMKGQNKQTRMVFNDIAEAWEFYRTQHNMIVQRQNKKFINK